MTNEDLNNILSKPGYGIAGTLKPGIASSLGQGTAGSKIDNSGEIKHMERYSCAQQVCPERLQIATRGKVLVRLKWYRMRLADSSRSISEKVDIDSAVRAGILKNDSEAEIRIIDEGQEKVTTKEEERTVITFEFPEVDFDNLWEACKRKDGR